MRNQIETLPQATLRFFLELNISSNVPRATSLAHDICYDHQIMKSRTCSILSLIACAQIVFSQWKCDYRIYGKPKLVDCAGAILSMPDATSKVPTSKLRAIRKFVEPQYLEPPFSECQSELDAPMEQLPKFWRYSSCYQLSLWIRRSLLTTVHRVGTCRVALMPVASSSGKVLDPEPVSTWSYIESNALRLSSQCLAKKLGGGFILVAGLTPYSHQIHTTS